MKIFKIYNTNEFTTYFLVDHNNMVHRLGAPAVVDFFINNYDDIFEYDLEKYSISKTHLQKINYPLYVALFGKFDSRNQKNKHEIINELEKVLLNI